MSPHDTPPRTSHFDEPWQAQAFALTVQLHQRGLFSWSEWAETLSAEVNQPAAAPDGHDYYEHWLRALEKMLATKGIATASEVDALSQAWRRAAHATPHAGRSCWRTTRSGHEPLLPPRESFTHG